MATKRTEVTYKFTAEEILEKLGLKGRIDSFSVPAKGQPDESKDDKKFLVLKIVVVGGKK